MEVALMDKLKGKKEVYEMWKKGLATWKEYSNNAKACRDVVRKATVQLEVNPETVGFLPSKKCVIH